MEARMFLSIDDPDFFSPKVGEAVGLHEVVEVYPNDLRDGAIYKLDNGTELTQYKMAMQHAPKGFYEKYPHPCMPNTFNVREITCKLVVVQNVSRDAATRLVTHLNTRSEKPVLPTFGVFNTRRA